MLNFNCECKYHKTIFVIKENEVVSLNEEKNPHISKYTDGVTYQAVNALIDTYFNTIKKTGIVKYLNGLDIKTLVKELRYLNNARDLLIGLKEKVYDRDSEVLLNFRSEVLKYFEDLFKQVKTKNFSYPEKAMLSELNVGFDDFNTWDTEAYYDPIKDKINSDLEGEYKETIKFNFEKFGFSKETMIKNYTSVYSNLVEDIKDFKILLKISGNDLVNWTEMKMKLRVKKETGNLPGHVFVKWAETYKEYLIKNGIAKKEVKKSTVKVSKEKLDKGKASQADLLRLFKTNVCGLIVVIEQLDLTSIQELLDSTLKCVVGKLVDNASEIVKRMSTLVSTKQEYKNLVKVCERFSKWSSVSWECLIKHQDYITINEMFNYGKAIGEYKADSKFFNKVLTRMPKEDRLKMSTSISHEYLKRMTPPELIENIPNITSQYVYTCEHVLKFYSDLPYSDIREAMLKNKDFLVECIKLIVKNQDKEAAKICLTKHKSSFGTKELITLCNLLSYSEKEEIIIQDIPQTYNPYNTSYNLDDSDLLGKVFNASELLTLLNKVLAYSSSKGTRDYVKGISESYLKLKGNIQEYNKVIMVYKENVACLEKFPISLKKHNEEVGNPLLENTTKLLLISCRCVDLFGEEKSYCNKNPAKIKKEFFSTLTRKEIDQVYPQGIDDTRITMYLAHVMTMSEVEELANINKNFFRYNLKWLSYGYLERFNNKEKFKECVGDLRKPENRKFAVALQEKIKSPAIDFIQSLSAELSA